MTRHRKTLPARRQRDALDDSVLIRSAESLGRMIGSLQRQLDGASKKVSGTASAARLTGVEGHEAGNKSRPAAKTAELGRRSLGGGGSRKASRVSTGNAKGGSKSGATKVRSTADRKTKRASKSAAAKKTAGRSRSGASRKSAKTGRRA
jgi:hypothetical protein